MRIPLLLYGLALAVRLVLVWHFPDPAYPDSFYYVDVARALVAGDGFNVDFIWIFPEVGGVVPAHPVLPIPSNAHWMPLASLIQVPFLLLFGNVAWASALPFALLGATAAPLTWAIARDAGARRLVAIGAGFLVAIPVLSLTYMAQPDNFSLFQPLVAGSLWMGARGLKGSPRSFALAGLLAGAATLSRNDGLLVLVALGLAFAWDRWRGWRSPMATTDGGATIPSRPAIPLGAAIACVGLFVLVMAPWWIRQLAVFGSISPSSTSGRVFFIRDIGEWNSITVPATLDHLLGMGIGPFLATRIGGLVAAVMIFTTLIAGFVLAPFMVIGGWARRRSLDFGPFFLYAGLLFGFSALISAVHVPGGTFIHSAVALAPHAYILALEGIAIAVAWLAARRRSWDPVAATTVFTGATARLRGRGRAVRVAVRAPGLGGQPGQVHGGRRGPEQRRRSPHGPRHVHRCVRDEVLDRPWRCGPRQRPHRDRRTRRARVRHALARPRRRGQRRGGRADPRRRRAAGLAGRADRVAR